MKPHILKFSCFGPYVGEQIIDFSAFYKTGLFLINGETGSGKTAILDAITYALYGKSSGGLRGDFASMRCQLSDPFDICYVDFTFSVGNKKYRFYKKLLPIKKRGGGVSSYKLEQNAFICADNVETPIFENPKRDDLSKKACEIIGLNDEQFRQVMILPQGQFEKFLTSSSDEKEKILVTLFDADKWQKAADILKDSMNIESRRIKFESDSISQALSEYGCEDILTLNEKIHNEQSAYDSLIKSAKLKKEAAASLRQRLETEQLIFDAFSRLESAKKSLMELTALESEMKDKAEFLKKAQAAKELKPYFLSLEESEKKLILCEKELMRESAHNESLSNSLSKTKKTLDDLSKKETAAKKQRELLVKIEDLPKKLDTSKKQLIKLNNTIDLIAKSIPDKQKKLSELKKDYDKKYKRFFKEIGGLLSENLAEGVPCPVCGSIHHPSPAPKSSSAVTREELDSLNNRILSLQREIDKAQSDININRAMAVHELESIDLIAAEISGVEDDKIISAANDPSELHKLIQFRKSYTDTYFKNLESAKSSFTDINSQLASSSALINHIDKQLEVLKNDFSKKSSDAELRWKSCGFSSRRESEKYLIDSAHEASLEAELNDYKLDLESSKRNTTSLLKQLNGRQKPDIAALKKAADEADLEYSRLEKDTAVMKSSLDRLAATRDKLEKRSKRLAEDKEIFEKNFSFAKLLRGETQTGISLERYVLGVMLSAVTSEANKLLKSVYDGRYSIYRRLSKTGQKRSAGLDIDVLDRLSGERRSATSLSGGEKFLVSLALSLALSSVVQTQSAGISMDTIFIDEGFGTLDSSTVADALSILSGLSGRNGLVGIISHVSLLKESITSQLQVTKTSKGSICRIL